MNLHSLVEKSEAMDLTKSDYLATATAVSYEGDQCAMIVPDEGGIFGPGSAVSLGLKERSLSQLCDKLGPPQAAYMTKCPPQLRANNLNYWQQQVKHGTKWLIRGNGGWARAVLSEGYSPISNTKILQIVAELMQHVEHKLVSPYLDPDTLHLKITVADSKGGNYAIGAYVGNGEVGNKSVRVTPFIQRHSCSNSIIYTDGAFVQRHYRVTEAFVFGAVKEKLGQAFELSVGLIEKMVRAETELLPDLAQVVDSLCGVRKYNDEVKTRILAGSEGLFSRAGLIHGLSYAAHATPGIDARLRQDLEEQAGAVLAMVS